MWFSTWPFTEGSETGHRWRFNDDMTLSCVGGSGEEPEKLVVGFTEMDSSCRDFCSFVGTKHCVRLVPHLEESINPKTMAKYAKQGIHCSFRDRVIFQKKELPVCTPSQVFRFLRDSFLSLLLIPGVDSCGLHRT